MGEEGVESWDRDLLTKDPTGDAFALIVLAFLYVPDFQPRKNRISGPLVTPCSESGPSSYSYR